MYLPDYLFFEPQQIKDQLTTVYTGTIDVAVALQGDTKCWVKPDILRLKQKKTLVISDFRLEQMTDEECKERVFLLHQLLSEGFSIQLWQKQGLVELNKQNVGMLLQEQVRRDCTPVHPSVLIKQLASKSITAEVLDLNALVHLEKEIDQKKTLKKALPLPIPIEALFTSRFLLQDIISAHPDITWSIKERSADNMRNNGLLEKMTGRMAAFDSEYIDNKVKTSSLIEQIPDQEPSAEQLRATKELTIKLQFEPKHSLKELLSKFDNIEVLKFFGVPLDAVEMDLTETDQFSSVHTLDLSASYNIDPDNETDLSASYNIDPNNETLLRLVKALPNLKKIIMSSGAMSTPEQLEQCLVGPAKLAAAPQVEIWHPLVYMGIDGDFIKKYNASNKETELNDECSNLSLMNTQDLTTAELIPLLNKMSHVSRTTLNDGLAKGAHIPEQTEVPYLRHLDCMLNDDNMALARLAPNLTALSIIGIEPVESFKPYTLNTLASLGFTAKDLSTLATLPRFVPNLQEMEIRFDKNALYDSTIISDPIDSLKKITISGEAWGNTVFPNYLMNFLMRLAPNLENIQLSHSGFKGKNIFRPFPNLRVINCDSKSIKNETVGDILKCLPKLESLVTSDSISSVSQDFLKESSIPERLALKKLSLIQPHSQSASFLATIVQRSPDLEELNLKYFRGCAQFFKKLIESGAQLPHLKKINFANTNLAYKDLLLLKQIAPNLTTIDISETPASTHEDLKKPGNEIVVNYEIINNIPYPGFILSSRAEDDHNTLDMDLEENEENRRLPARASNQALEGGSEPSDQALEGGSEPSNQGSGTQRQNNNQKKSRKVDTDTSLNDTKFELTEVFKSTVDDNFTPPPGLYRIDVYNEAAVNDPFDLNTTGDMQLEPYQDYHYGDAAVKKESSRLNLNVFIGKHAMLLTNEFKALPSLNANEFIKSLNVSGLAANDVEIQYSKSDNLYYIRKKSPGQFNATVDFSIEIKHPSYDENLELEEFIQYFKGFGAGALDLKGQNNLSPEALAEEMFKQRLGRCEQRAVVFKYMAQKKFPDWQVRIIGNDCHSYVEVKQGGFWIKHDLGGYPAKTNIKKVEDVPKAEEALSATTISRSRTTIEEIDPRYVTWDTTEVVDPTPNGIAMRALAATRIDSATGEDKVKTYYYNVKVMKTLRP